MDTAVYLVDVRPVLEDLGGVIAVDARVELPVITLGTEEFVPRTPALVRMQVTNTGAGIVASGMVSIEFEATCSRCLSGFVLPLTAEVDGFFVHHGGGADLPEEQDFGFIEDGSVDLMPCILSALALEAPFAPLHDPECKGICPSCGADLNAGDCGCPPPESASPFSALKSLLPEGGDDR